MDQTIAKKQLIDWIDDLDDEAMLVDLLAIKDDRRPPLEWDDLPEGAQASARRGLKDIQAGRSYTSSEMWEEINRRRNKRRNGAI